MKVTLVAHTPKPLYVCAEAAAVCYDSEPDLKIVKGCIRSGHHSVLEHASFTFKIEEVSRSCTHQLVRHRMASYSQQSQRYVKYDALDWVVPYGMDKDVIDGICDESLSNYLQLIEEGAKPEQARSILPNATPTVIYVTMNIRGLMNFFNERLCARAENEIRKVAGSMRDSILNAEDITQEEKNIFSLIFVPKCEKFDPHFCPENHGRCGKYPTLRQLIDGDR